MDNSTKFINIMFMTLSFIIFLVYGYDLIQTWISSGREIPWRESFAFAVASMALFIFTKQYLDHRKTMLLKNTEASNKDNKK